MSGRFVDFNGMRNWKGYSNTAGDSRRPGSHCYSNGRSGKQRRLQEVIPDIQENGVAIKEEETMLKVNVAVGDRTFSAKLYDNATTRELIGRMPMELDMSELHGNENISIFRRIFQQTLKIRAVSIPVTLCSMARTVWCCFMRISSPPSAIHGWDI